MSAQIFSTEVDLSGLLKVLGANLYSTPEVAVRELVQNAHDACTRRRIEAGDAFEASITVGAAKGRIWVEDAGAGLTRDEMQRYLATIGAGYTRVLRTNSSDDRLIGAFGLGFLSAYMIASRVEVVSTSFRAPDNGVRFVSDSGRTYAIDAVDPRPIGSRVEIELKDEFAALADLDRLARVVRNHCRLLSVPVHLDWSGEIVNDLEPPWRRTDLAAAPPIRARRERLSFARSFQSQFEPLCAIPIARESDDDAGDGLIWIHDADTYGSLDNRSLSVFVRGMRVAVNERELLPAWAGFVSGVFESDRLTPTASRESLQRDEVYTAAQSQIARQLAVGLTRLATEEPEAWRRVLRRHNEALLGAAIADDDLFEALKGELRLPTSDGELLAKEAVGPMGVYVARTEDRGADGLLAQTLGSPLVNGLRYGAYGFARKWADDSGVELIEVGTARGLDKLFPAAAISHEDLDTLKGWFGEGMRVRPARFTPDNLPLLILNDEDAVLKSFLESDAADARLNAGALAMARAFTSKIEGGPETVVVVNLDCPVTRAVLDLKGTECGENAARMLLVVAQLLNPRPAARRTNLSSALEQFSEALLALVRR